MEDTEMGDLSHEDNEITEEEVEKIQRANNPKVMGVMLTIFVAVMVIMIGGLASYYYYTTQKQDSTHEQTLRDNWGEVVLATASLTNAFDEIDDLTALFDDTKGSFQETLNDANRALKDVSYNLRSISGYAFSGNIVISKMEVFVEKYSDYLRELQSIIDQAKGGLVEDINELKDLTEQGDSMNEAYDNLIIADKGEIIDSILPSELFNMSREMEDLMQKYLDDKKKQGEEENKIKTAINDVASKFIQAYANKDADSMMSYLTDEAKTEFNPGIVEESVEITTFKILDTRLIGDNKSELDAQLTKETPSQETFTEKKRFILLKKGSQWLVDSWRNFS
ncbi:MAG: hypothetical protein V1719_01720 [Patescibacteria group bacterium]